MSSPARIVLAGGTGFLGAPLARACAAAGAAVTVLSRRPDAPVPPGVTAALWTPDDGNGAWATALDGADAVVNLAGESLAARRWSAAQKARLVDTRVRATRSLAAAIAAARTPPRVLVNASGIGYYGSRGDAVLTEQAPVGDGFIARLADGWESEALRARSARTRVVLARTSLVVAADGGALQPMRLPFRLGVGGRLGRGDQYWAWIHRDDWIAMIRWAIGDEAIDGALNVTAPNPVTNAAFTRALAHALHRPAILPAPAFALRLALGEMADELLLASQRAVPEKAVRGGFRFEYERIDEALEAVFR